MKPSNYPVSPRLLFIVLASLSILTGIFSGARRTFLVFTPSHWQDGPPRDTTPVYLQQLETLRARCLSNGSPPGPSSQFFKRDVSDRYEPGTNSTLITNATLLVGQGNETRVMHGDIYLDKGVLKNIGSSLAHLGLTATANLTVIDAEGAWVTPGLVDLDTRLGLMSTPFLAGASDEDSTGGPFTPGLRNIDGLNTHDEAFRHAVAGGVTSAQVLASGSSIIGGQPIVVKLRPTVSRSPSSMVLEHGDGQGWLYLQQSCGPSDYGNRRDVIWTLRAAYNEARAVKVAQDQFCSQVEAGLWDGSEFPEKTGYDILVDVLRGKVKVTSHCQTAVDIDALVRLSREFEFPLSSIQHASEAWLLPGLLNQTWDGPPTVALFSTDHGYDLPSYRGSEFAPRVLSDANISVILKTNHPTIHSRYLIQEAQKAHHFGLPSLVALASVTSNPAQALGLSHRIGNLYEGADADVVMWDYNPLQLGARPIRVWIDGQPQMLDVVGAPKQSRILHDFPAVPNWEKEVKEAIESDGLPPLTSRKEKGRIAFVNVGRFTGFSRQSTGDVNTVVVERGKIVCVGDQCPADLAAETIDLFGGVIVPGMTTFGSSLGLEEMRYELTTGDGQIMDPFQGQVPSIVHDPTALVNTIDSLVFGTRHALLAYRSGVTSAIAAPREGIAVSTVVSTGTMGPMERGALLQKSTALHVAVHRPDPKAKSVSVSTQIATLRRLLNGWESQESETGRWFRKAAEASPPSADVREIPTCTGRYSPRH
ncbi:unnamed protein product [Mycena citricolor]|uniref:Amidohydrolase 3 domain-containing protein n=1 Tax=Mycena citricolor TaxID=2018698 RepID=A0AAD2HGP8_9AGAR|nr:unnamed protein product [Mycena citricolor]